MAPAAPRAVARPVAPAPLHDVAPHDGALHEEAPYDEIPQDEAPSYEPINVSARKRKAVSELHTQLFGLFPELFHLVDESVPYYETKSDPATPLLILDPDLNRSWLRPPGPSPDDTVGYWPSKTCKLPPTRRSLFPPNIKSSPLGRAPFYHVADDRLRKTLDGTSQLDKVPLDLRVFDVTDVSVRNTPQASLDILLRKALLECYTADAYLQIMLDLTECVRGASQTVSQLEALELLPGVVRQAAMANARSAQSLSAGYVGNIVALRDEVIGRFSVPPRTKEVLRGGDFTGDSLFAPLPESYSSLLDTVQGAELRCSSKKTKPKSAPPRAPTVPAATHLPMKRPAMPAPYNDKRPKYNNAPRGRGQSFQNKPAGRGSKTGRF